MSKEVIVIRAEDAQEGKYTVDQLMARWGVITRGGIMRYVKKHNFPLPLGEKEKQALTPKAIHKLSQIVISQRCEDARKHIFTGNQLAERWGIRNPSVYGFIRSHGLPLPIHESETKVELSRPPAKPGLGGSALRAAEMKERRQKLAESGMTSKQMADAEHVSRQAMQQYTRVHKISTKPGKKMRRKVNTKPVSAAPAISREKKAVAAPRVPQSSNGHLSIKCPACKARLPFETIEFEGSATLTCPCETSVKVSITKSVGSA